MSTEALVEFSARDIAKATHPEQNLIPPISFES
jgi:hypothetical protein